MSAHAFADFDTALATAESPDAVWDALCALARATVGARLFTIMELDPSEQVARRAYTSHPAQYPTSGTKPFEMNPWFDTVMGRQDTFVANTIEEIAQVFGDHLLIHSLGCASVVNQPLIVEGRLVGTMNLLDEAGHYTPDKVAYVRTVLSGSAVKAWEKAATFA